MRRLRSILVALPLSAAVLTGCGSSDGSASVQPTTTSTPTSSTPAASSAPGSTSAEQCRELQGKYPDQLATLRVLPPNILRALRKNPRNTAALDEATGAVGDSDLVKNPAAALQRVLQLQRTPAAQVQLLIDCAGVKSN